VPWKSCVWRLAQKQIAKDRQGNEDPKEHRLMRMV
jgi:hypothetical protein